MRIFLLKTIQFFINPPTFSHYKNFCNTFPRRNWFIATNSYLINNVFKEENHQVEKIWKFDFVASQCLYIFFLLFFRKNIPENTMLNANLQVC